MKERKLVKLDNFVIEESDSPEDLKRKEELQKIARSIKGANAPGQLIFADKDHWAIEID